MNRPSHSGVHPPSVFFVGEGLLLFLGVHLLVWVYLDDILLLSPDPSFLGTLTGRLVTHIAGLGLLVSKKSRPIPSQSRVWLGKLFDLRAGSLAKSTSSLTHALGACFLACLGTLTVKRLDALMGYLLWVFRPQRGCTLFLRSWYERRWMPARFKGAASLGMRRALLDCLAIAFGGWVARPPSPRPSLSRFLRSGGACKCAALKFRFFIPYENSFLSFSGALFQARTAHAP